MSLTIAPFHVRFDAAISFAAMLQRAPPSDQPNSGVPRAFDPTGLDPKKLAKLKAKPARIRCPVCFWEPKRRDKWACAPMGSPENFRGGCGRVWHTFDTKGVCPGCCYQWVHTTCLRCSAVSLHDDWYEQTMDRN